MPARDFGRYWAAYGPYPALSYTLFQERVPGDSLTGVLAVRSAVLLTGSPLGAAAGGVLVDRAGAPAVLTGSGGLMILIAVLSATVLKLSAARRSSRMAAETVAP
jgi:predicted MFS family arabinose efflux permease